MSQANTGSTVPTTQHKNGEGGEQQIAAAALADCLPYARRVFDNIIVWYNNADTKAQIILSLDGAFLAFLITSAFAKKDDLNVVLDQFNWTTTILMSAMCVTLLGSIGCALACLLSRLYTNEEKRQLLPETRPQKPDTPQAAEVALTSDQTAKIIWFFQLIACQTPEEFNVYLKGVTQESELSTMASQIHVLSMNVLKKHRWVNRGFVLTGVSLFLFLAAGVSYLSIIRGW